MMYTKTQLQFHETFQPQTEYISAVLELSCNAYSGTKEQISEMTGIPTGKQKGKVVPHLKYAQYMGLIRFSCEGGVYTLNATQLGQHVYAEDSYLLEGLSRNICHYYLISKQDGAPQWSYLFHSLPHLLDRGVDYEFAKERADAFFGFPVDLGIVYNSYQTGMFEPLNILGGNDKELVFNRGYISKQLTPVYAYTLLDTWEHVLPQQREIPLPDILNVLGWGTAFGFDGTDISMVIDALADEQYIQVNRQLYPVTVIRFAQSHELLDRLYSKLI